jgi:hypothetical protein
MDPQWEKKGHRPRANVPICFPKEHNLCPLWILSLSPFWALSFQVNSVQRMPNSALYLSTHFPSLFCKASVSQTNKDIQTSPAAKLVLVSEDKGTPWPFWASLND